MRARTSTKAAASFAILCLAALVFGDVSRGVHLLTARHVLCAVHGDLMEAGSEGEPERPSVGGTSAALPAEPELDHHEHCTLAATPTRTFASVVSTALVATTIAEESIVVAVELPGAYASDVLAYAPKQGPPAVA